jgi:hypothetical protein
VCQALPVLAFPLGQLLPVRLEPGIPSVHNILRKQSTGIKYLTKDLGNIITSAICANLVISGCV